MTLCKNGAHAKRAAALAYAAALFLACLDTRCADLILGRRDAALRLDSIAWQWTNGGERPWRDEIIAELDPRGECVLVVVGGPDARRLLLVAPGKEPVVVTRSYLELKPPVFASDGSAFYFSATTGEYARDGKTYVHAGVFRADRSGVSKRIYPPGTDADTPAFGMLLDVCPANGALLIGTGFDLERLVLPHGGFGLSAAERDPATGVVRTFDARVNARSPAFYHRDGTGFFFHTAPPFGRLYPLSFYDLATRKARTCPWNTDSGGSPAGELLAFKRTVRHLGGFRDDDFPVFLAAKAARSPRVRLDLGPAFAPLLGKDLTLKSLRGPFALFTHGEPGRETYSVVAVPRGALASLLAEDGGRDVRYTPLRVLWGEAPDATRALLLDARARLAPPPLPADAMATYVREAIEPGVAFREEVTCYARADGKTLVQLTSEGERGPKTVWWGRDGAHTWLSGEEGPCDAPQSAFGVIDNAYSPYRILFDPAGLLDPEIRFAQMRAEGERIAIPFSYADGYHGTLWLDAKTLLPHTIESPVNFFVAVRAQKLGAVSPARSVRFDEWRTTAGRLVPGELTFHDGVTTFRLRLTALRVDAGLTEGMFSPPSTEAPPEH